MSKVDLLALYYLLLKIGVSLACAGVVVLAIALVIGFWGELVP
jgi:hypothetical protein